MGGIGKAMLSELIIKYYDNLNQNDLYLCQFIGEHKKECVDMTIEEMAEKSHISRSSILRFAKKLSLKGYSELKVYLKMDVQREQLPERDVLAEVCDDYHRAINEFRTKDCMEICRMIYEADRIFLYGTGGMQEAVAKEMQRKFLYAGKCMYNCDGQGAFEQTITLANKNDLVIMISLSGESESTLAYAKQIKMKNIPLIAITKMKANKLVRLSDESIYAGTSVINSSMDRHYETSVLYLILTEILLVKYITYKEKREKENSSTILKEMTEESISSKME